MSALDGSVRPQIQLALRDEHEIGLHRALWQRGPAVDRFQSQWPFRDYSALAVASPNWSLQAAPSVPLPEIPAFRAPAQNGRDPWDTVAAMRPCPCSLFRSTQIRSYGK